MSWTAYIDTMTQQGIPMCGIYVKDSGQVCAQTSNMKVTPAEVGFMRNCMSGKEYTLEVNGQPCVMTQADEGCVKGKTKGLCLDGDKVFFHCESTSNYIVIAGMNGAGERQATTVCGQIASHLKNSGY